VLRFSSEIRPVPVSSASPAIAAHQARAGRRTGRRKEHRFMVKIRLKRGGAKKRPYYRVIAIDERKKRDGRALEYLGSYNPMVEPAEIKLEREKIEAWVAKGAQLSGAVRGLLRRSKRQAQAVAVEVSP